MCTEKCEIWANDNTSCYTLLLLWQFLSNTNIIVCLYHLIWHHPTPPNQKDPKRLLCFESVQDTEVATTLQLKMLMKENFQNCFSKWQEWWDKYLQSEGKHFEEQWSFIVKHLKNLNTHYVWSYLILQWSSNINNRAENFLQPNDIVV